MHALISYVSLLNLASTAYAGINVPAGAFRPELLEGTELVVVGAHAFGKGDDKFYKHLAAIRWVKAVLVEANPELARRLQAAVEERRGGHPLPRVPHVVVRNEGLCPGKEVTTLPFHAFSLDGEPGLPHYSSMLSSFSRQHLLSQLQTMAGASNGTWSFNRLMSHVVTVPVVCRPLSSLLLAATWTHGATTTPEGDGRTAEVGVLMIDVESLDCQVIASHNWCAPQPAVRLLVFEAKHCGALERQQANATLTRPCRAGSGYPAFQWDWLGDLRGNAFYSRRALPIHAGG